MNSQQKGKRKEREIAHILNRKFNANVRRTPNSGGLSFKGDIVSLRGIISEFHWEIKNQETIQIWGFMEQAIRDCPIQKIPLLVFSRAFTDNYVALRLDDFLNLVKELEELRKNVPEDNR